jgi:hypothetical protein
MTWQPPVGFEVAISCIGNKRSHQLRYLAVKYEFIGLKTAIHHHRIPRFWQNGGPHAMNHNRIQTWFMGFETATIEFAIKFYLRKLV